MDMGVNFTLVSFSVTQNYCNLIIPYFKWAFVLAFTISSDKAIGLGKGNAVLLYISTPRLLWDCYQALLMELEDWTKGKVHSHCSLGTCICIQTQM